MSFFEVWKLWFLFHCEVMENSNQDLFFHRRKKAMWIWNDQWVSQWWQNIQVNSHYRGYLMIFPPFVLHSPDSHKHAIQRAALFSLHKHLFIISFSACSLARCRTEQHKTVQCMWEVGRWLFRKRNDEIWVITSWGNVNAWGGLLYGKN